MLSRDWKMGLVVVMVLTLLLPGFQRAEAATPAKTGLEVKMAINLTAGEVTFPLDNHLGGLAGNGEFYLYADKFSRLWRSEDGLHWKTADFTLVGEYDNYFPDTPRKLIWDGQQFVLLLWNQVWSSKDGREWEDRTPVHPNESKEYTFEDIIYANGQYVILAQDRKRNVEGLYMEGPNTIFVGKKLSELKTAEKRDMINSMAGERPLSHVAWNGKMYLAGGNGGAYSYDGKVWYGGGAGFYELNIISDGTRFWRAWDHEIDVIDAKGMTSKVAYKLPKDSDIYLTNMGYNGHSYLAAGNSGSGAFVMYSRDGVQWSKVQLGSQEASIHSIIATPFGYLLAGSGIWYVSEAAINSPSAWAKSELEEAVSYNLVSDAVNGFYQSSISRQDFSILPVKLYEALTGKLAEAPTTNPFRDTVHSFVLKANKLGLIKGLEPTKFGPTSSISRQDMAVILYRTLQLAGLDLSSATSQWRADYSDLNKVASYAEEALRYMNQEGIIGGRSADRLDPAGTATREEAITMVVRLYERFKNVAEHEEVMVQRSLNVDGRFVWNGDAIKQDESYLVPLEEVMEPLGLHEEWDSLDNRLLLSKTEPDYTSQQDTGLGEHSIAASKPFKIMAVRNELKYNAGKSDTTVPIMLYRNQRYVSLSWLADTFGWDHSLESPFDDPSLEFDLFRSPGTNAMYFYWENNEAKYSWFDETIKVGERYIIRKDGGLNGRVELKIIMGEDRATVMPIPNGWILTGVKTGYVICSITNLDTQEVADIAVSVE